MLEVLQCLHTLQTSNPEWIHDQLCHPDTLYLHLQFDVLARCGFLLLGVKPGFVALEDIAMETDGLEPQLYKLPDTHLRFHCMQGAKKAFQARDLIRVIRTVGL